AFDSEQRRMEPAMIASRHQGGANGDPATRPHPFFAPLRAAGGGRHSPGFSLLVLLDEPRGHQPALGQRPHVFARLPCARLWPVAALAPQGPVPPGGPAAKLVGTGAGGGRHAAATGSGQLLLSVVGPHFVAAVPGGPRFARRRLASPALVL